MRVLAGVLVAVGVAVGGSGVDAASVLARASGFACGEQVGSNTAISASASCPNSGATATFGSLSAWSSSDVLIGSDGTRLINTGNGGASASFSDTMFFSIQTGTVSIPFDFDGDLFLSLVPTPGGSVAPNGGGSARVTGGVSGNQVGSQWGFVKTISASGNLRFENGIGSGVQTVVFEIVNGEVRFAPRLGAETTCAIGGIGGFVSGCSARSDYSSSLRLLGATVRNDAGEIVQDAYLGSDSGFNYLEGVEPHDRTAVIPLPASVWLVLGGLSALWGVGRRRV